MTLVSRVYRDVELQAAKKTSAGEQAVAEHSGVLATRRLELTFKAGFEPASPACRALAVSVTYATGQGGFQS